MIKAIIIDDEPQSRNWLREILPGHFQKAAVGRGATDKYSNIERSQNKQPEVILLDPQKLDSTELDLLNVLNHRYLNVIVVMAYSPPSVKALETMDHLLKSVDLEELQLAIQKLSNSRKEEKDRSDFPHDQDEGRKKELQQIVLPGRDCHVVIRLHDIIRIEAQGSYVMIHMEGQKTHLVVNSLSYYEKLLPTDIFFRIHKSHLINVQKVERIAAGRRGKVRLKDGSELNIAARRKSSFNQFIKQKKKI
ncbi:MAG: LytTR family DNA-binding domain-containing protein [Bacteroidota bacterium]